MTPRGCCEHGHAAEQEPPVGDQPCLVPGGVTGKDSRGFGHTEDTGRIGAEGSCGFGRVGLCGWGRQRDGARAVSAPQLYPAGGPLQWVLART